MRYLLPLTPYEEVIVTSELVADRKGRILEAKSAIHNSAGKILAEATGKYIPIKSGDTSLMMADFASDARWLIDGVCPSPGTAM